MTLQAKPAQTRSRFPPGFEEFVSDRHGRTTLAGSAVAPGMASFMALCHESRPILATPIQAGRWDSVQSVLQLFKPLTTFGNAEDKSSAVKTNQIDAPLPFSPQPTAEARLTMIDLEFGKARL